MSPASQHFRSSFDDDIPISPNYLSQFGGNLATASRAETNYNVLGRSLSLGDFVLKNYEAGLILDRIRKQGLQLNFSSMLDLGSGMAAMPRICHVRGFARDVTCIDLYPWGKRAASKSKVHRWLAMLWLVDKLRLKNVRGPMLRWEWTVTSDNFSFPWPRRTGQFNYIVGNLYDHSGKYDWINSSLTINYFEPKALLKKVAGLLSDGGIFTFIGASWWFPRNQTQLAGKMPYAAQRLIRADFARYLKEHHSDADHAHVMGIYDEFTADQPPSMNQYVEAAIAVGLHPIFIDGHMTARETNGRCGITAPHLEQHFGEGPRAALSNIERFRSDVTLSDLYTSHYLMGFKKVMT